MQTKRWERTNVMLPRHLRGILEPQNSKRSSNTLVWQVRMICQRSYTLPGPQHDALVLQMAIDNQAASLASIADEYTKPVLSAQQIIDSFWTYAWVAMGELVTDRITPFNITFANSPCDCSIHVLQFNTCSVIANLNEIKSQIFRDKPQLVLIQEDWLNNSFGCKIPDYHWIHFSCTIKYTSEKTCGGGVSILVRNNSLISFECLHLPLDDDLSTTDIMVVWFFYHNPTGLTVIDIINIYHLTITSYVYANCSPSFNFQSLLHPLCEGNDHLPYDNHVILLCGDINSHSKLWDNHSPEDNIGKEIASFLLDYGFIIDNDGNPTYHAHKCHMAPDLTTHWGDIIIDHWLLAKAITMYYLMTL